MAEIALTSSMRQNVVSLQLTESLISRTQDRLATGKRVNSALDNPTNYFVAARHSQRANDLTGRKDSMGEAIQSIKAADTGITGMKTLLEAAKGIVESARTAATTDDRSALGTQFSQILLKINDLVEDADYKGVNYLENGSLTVLFNEDGTNALTVTGFSAEVSSLGVVASGGSLATGGGFDAAASQIQAALTTLTTQASILSSNLSVISARQDFTTNLVNVLKEGVDKLTLADMNEEGANMLALQTRQNLGVTSLSLASQAAQSVLRLFG